MNYVSADQISYGDVERALDAAFRAVIGHRPGHGKKTANVAKQEDARKARADAICALREQGLTQDQIAHDLNISQSLVHYYLKKRGAQQ